MDIQKEREAFECEFKQTDYYIAHGDLSTLMLCDDQYALDDVQVSFEMWQAAKAQAQAVPEKDAVIKKLSDQLYEQEMKTSAARVLCETACELLDDYAHQDAMVILNDLEQAMSTGASQ